MGGPNCTLYIAGQPVAATKDALASSKTTALAGLQVRWGRASRLDQPAPSTMTARLALPDGADAVAVMDAIQAGTRVEVVAQSTITPADQTVTTHPMAGTGGQILSSNPLAFRANGNSGTVVLTPAPIPIAADGWNYLPRVQAGERYTLAITAQLQPGHTLTVRPAYFDAPTVSGYTAQGDTITIRNGGTATTSMSRTAQWLAPSTQAGTWIGLLLTLTTPTPKWNTETNTWAQENRTWADLTRVTIPACTLTRKDPGVTQATVFQGRVTSAPVAYDQALHRPVMTLTASDVRATLANTVVGADPWPTQAASARIAAILAQSPEQLTTVLDPTPAALTLAARDADATTLIDLLEEVAHSTGAILWTSAIRGVGEYLRLEDQRTRKSLYRLIVPSTGPVQMEVSTAGALPLSAKALDRRGVAIMRDVTDLATTVKVGWSHMTQPSPGEVEVTQETVTVTDPARQAAHGLRTMSVRTALTTQADAQNLADYLLAATAPGGWTIPTVHWDTDRPATNEKTLAAALDASKRIGLPLVLQDIDAWVPGAPSVPVYLDGGNYSYTQGRWVLDLTLTRAATSTKSITWNQSPAALTWERTDAFTWADLSSATI